MDRRQWMTAALALPMGVPAPAATETYRNYFGDLHNHGNVGYAQGSSPARLRDRARAPRLLRLHPARALA